MEKLALGLFVGNFKNEFDDVTNPDVTTDITIVTAPGRVNLIGEHTDYNDGFVMPVALELGTWAVARLRHDGSKACRIVSSINTDVYEFQLGEEDLKPGDDGWEKYIKGVIFQYFDDIKQSPRGVVGFDIAFASNVPLGGGLSSSASLEVCTAIAIEQLFAITTVTPTARALRCVMAEHDFANVPCGIMDQFISSGAVAGHALLVDCRSMQTQPVAFANPNLSIVVTNSNVKHKLSGSEYPDRVRQCTEAVGLIDRTLQDNKKRSHLRDCTIEDLEATYAKKALPDVIYKRARHVITENQRTREASDAAAQGQYDVFGKLMNASHLSLRDDYEVSIPEIDFLVKIAQDQPGVYGSRITGGGFGGCTVTLVESSHAEALMKSLAEKYHDFFGKTCTSFSTTAGSGARVLVNILKA